MLRDAAPYQFKGELLKRLMGKEHYPNRVGFADLLMEEHGDCLLCASYRTSKGDVEGDPYYLRDTGLWEKNSPVLRSHVHDMCQRLKADTWVLPPKGLVSDETKRPGAKAKIDAAANSAERVVALIPDRVSSWSRSRPHDLSKLTVCDQSNLDKNGQYLGCENGVVDLETGQLLDPEEARKHLVTRSTGVKYHAGATDWAIDELTSHLDEELAEYLWAVLGRALWGKPEKMLVVLIGPGDAGKSTLFSAVSAALGPWCGSFGPDLLRPGHLDRNKQGPTPERAVLVEKRIAYATEVEDYAVDAVKTKHFAGGAQDTIAHQPKYQAEDSFPLTATLFLTGNDYPALALDDEALALRLRCIPYSKPRQLLDGRDGRKHLANAVGTEKAREAMLARLVKFAVANPPGEDVPVPETVQRETEERVSMARGAFGNWLRDRLVRDQDSRVSGQAIWEAWADHVGVSPDSDIVGGVKKKDRAKRIRAIFGVDPKQLRIDGENVRGYEGLRLWSGSVVFKFEESDSDPRSACKLFPNPSMADVELCGCSDCIDFARDAMARITKSLESFAFKPAPGQQALEVNGAATGAATGGAT